MTKCEVRPHRISLLQISCPLDQGLPIAPDRTRRGFIAKRNRNLNRSPLWDPLLHSRQKEPFRHGPQDLPSRGSREIIRQFNILNHPVHRDRAVRIDRGRQSIQRDSLPRSMRTARSRWTGWLRILNCRMISLLPQLREICCRPSRNGSFCRECKRIREKGLRFRFRLRFAIKATAGAIRSDR